MIQCPDCNRIVMDKTTDGGWKLRTRMVLFGAKGAVALCPSCKTQVPVPVNLTSEPDAVQKTKLVVQP